MELKEMHCKPCEGGEDPLDHKDIIRLQEELSQGWSVKDDQSIHKSFLFENFNRGMAFANQIALLAEKENHHPNLCIQYKKVDVSLSTHAIGGLSKNDFILAAKIDEI
ncbi:MAG: 4a-hydroxytetrahydrobiopterin dehydratase [Bacteroidetes bacterium]|nr:4a-hydroxytetrahydrobiopterin dehydratase [Bacteroidota bacterium]